MPPSTFSIPPSPRGRQRYANSSVVVWRPPFSSSSDPVVRAAFAEFRAHRTSYGIGDVIAHMSKYVAQSRQGKSPAQQDYDSAWFALRKLKRAALPPRDQF
jgi:hypothetical protein